MRNPVTLTIGLMILFCVISVTATNAQTTAFKYQGSLNDAGTPANGSFQMQFKLFDAVSGGTQIGPTLTDLPVTAVNGIVAVSLDFGSNALDGSNRWLEIALRRTSGESYVTLSPREQITSSPYSIRTISAAMADDSQKLGGVAANQYVTTTTNSFIKNDTALQTANFNISGNGRVGGNFGIGTATPNAGLELRGSGSFPHQRITDTGSGNSLVLQAGSGLNMKVTGFNYNTFTPVPLHVGVDGANTFINPQGGAVSIGSTNVPTHALDVWGFIRASHTAGGNVVSETFGGTNSWARLWARTPVQSWAIGSSNNFNGNQLYFSNENVGGGIRMAIMPNGNMVQNVAGYGLPKAMLHVLANGVISRCYNGATSATVTNNNTSSACGYSVSHPSLSYYDVTVDFDVSQRFFVATQHGAFTGDCGGGYAYINSFGGSTVRVATSCGGLTYDRPFWFVIY